MKIVVQKFGGTSMATPESRERAAAIVAAAIERELRPAVVVSAIGCKGQPYATDTLIEMAREACATIRPRENDLMVSCGEIISSVVMVQTLRSKGIEAVALTGAQAGIVTDDDFGRCRVKHVVPGRIRELLETGRVPVVAGFQGISEGGDVTTLGRGGSDTTAGVLGAALQAECVEIYSDVDGVLTADPRVVETATLVREASYAEVCELAYKGTKVIHPRAVEIAAGAGVPVLLKSTFRDSPGTAVHEIKHDRPVTGVASRSDIVLVRILPDAEGDYSSGLRIFSIFADEKISVDFIDILPHEITFVVDGELSERVEAILSDRCFSFSTHAGFAKVSIVGAGMTGLPGIMSTVVESLTREKIQIRQATDSHTSISCLIDREHERHALIALHEAFGLSKSGSFRPE